MMAAAASYLVGTYFFVYAYFVPDGTEGACWTIAGIQTSARYNWHA